MTSDAAERFRFDIRDDASADLLRLIIDQGAVSIWASRGRDHDYEIVYWTSGAERLYGIERDDALGKNYLNLFVSDGDRPQSRLDCDNIIETGDPIKNWPANDERPDGRMIHVLSYGFRVRDTYLDEWLQAEVAFEASHLESRYQQLNQIYVESLEHQAVALAESLTRDFRHLAKNDAGPIALRAQTILESLKRGQLDERELRQDLRAIRRMADELQRSVDGLLGHLEVDRFDLVAIVRSKLTELRLTKGEGVGISDDLPRTPVHVVGVQPFLRAALENLINNSIEALTEQSLGRKPQLRVQVSSEWDGHGAQTARVVIDDNGPGVPAEIRERVFEEGFSTKGASRGLGLARARETIEQYGGSIVLGESPMGGTRVTVSLPVSPEEVE